ETGQHFRTIPEELLNALHPFEVADDDAARIAENVGDDEDLVAPHVENAVCVGCRRPVRSLGENAALQALRDLGIDDSLHGRRNQNVTALYEKLARIEFALRRKAFQRARS